MDILNSEFLLFLSCAKKCRLNYLLIGGYAVNYYGYTRNTKDLGVWIEPTNENRHRFIDTLICMNYTEQETSPLLDEDFTQPFTATIGAWPSAMDFLTFIHRDIDFSTAFKSREIFITENGIEVFFIPYEFLKESKLRRA